MWYSLQIFSPIPKGAYFNFLTVFFAVPEAFQFDVFSLVLLLLSFWGGVIQQNH